MLRNTTLAWGAVSRHLHWLIAAMIAVQVPLGFWMNSVYDELVATGGTDFSQLLAISRVHHTNGFLILILATVRLAWRAGNPTPGLPAALAAYQRWLARLTHVFLYGLLFAFPLSGWAALSAYEGEFPIFFFGWDDVPRIVPQAADGSHAPYEFYAEIHETCWRLGAVVLGLHVAGALWHHLVVKDNVLRRMLRGT
jgi:cytochrome b561